MHVTLKVDGMTCNGCVAAVRNVLARQSGVQSSKVEIGKVELDVDEAAGSLDSIRAAVEKAGYTVTSTV
jgi:copper chaperone